MKRLFITLCALMVTAVAAESDGARKMYVSGKDAVYRASPSFFSETVGQLLYGESVYVIQIQKSWAEVEPVRDRNQRGWVPVSALTSKKIVLNDRGEQKVTASTEELALAGKGFSSEIENTFKTKKNLDYSAIDKMEQIVPDFSELRDFIISGYLEGIYR